MLIVVQRQLLVVHVSVSICYHLFVLPFLSSTVFGFIEFLLLDSLPLFVVVVLLDDANDDRHDDDDNDAKKRNWTGHDRTTSWTDTRRCRRLNECGRSEHGDITVLMPQNFQSWREKKTVDLNKFGVPGMTPRCSASPLPLVPEARLPCPLGWKQARK